MGYVIIVALFGLIVYEVISTIKAIKKRKIALKERDKQHQEKLKDNENVDVESKVDVNEKSK